MAASCDRNPVVVGIRDGEVVHLKRCSACGEMKRVDQRGELSEFPVNVRADDRVLSWKPQCKPCFAVKMRAWRKAHLQHVRRGRRRVYAERMRDPENVAARRAAEQSWRERKLLEDPEYFRDYRRMKAALDRGLVPAPPRECPAGERLPAEPFAAYLRAYQDEMGYEDAAEMAHDLDIVERRARAVLNGEQGSVVFDVVDRAVLNARCPVMVWGVLVHRLDDLYGEGGFPDGATCSVSYAPAAAAAA